MRPSNTHNTINPPTHATIIMSWVLVKLPTKEEESEDEEGSLPQGQPPVALQDAAPTILEKWNVPVTVVLLYAQPSLTDTDANTSA